MIRASVMANDSRVVDTVASLLAQEIAPDVLQLTYCLSRNTNEYIRDHNSVVIVIDDGESNTAALPAPWSGRNDGPVLLIKATLKAINLDICQGHQLTDSRMEQVANLVKDFSRSYLRKIDRAAATWAI